MKVVGDSPEICRVIDAYDFSDFKRSTEKMRALTSVLDINDPERFGFVAPKEVWHTIVRCWTLEPTSARIIAVIEDFGNVLDLMIEFKGCVVPECRLRHDHRQQAYNGGRVLKRKVTKRHRKHLLTMGPVHPDAQGALNILLSIDEVAKLAFTEIEEALIIKENNLNQIPDVFMEEEDEIAEEYDINEPNF